MNLEKAQGAGIPGAPGFALGMGERNQTKPRPASIWRIHKAPRSHVWFPHVDPLQPPASFVHRTARDPTSLEPMWCWCGVEQGPCFRWVFTVTNKAQLAQPLHQHWFSNGMGWRLVGSWHGAGMQTCLAGVVSCSSARKGRRSRGTKQHESSRGTQPQEHRAVWGHLGAE